MATLYTFGYLSPKSPRILQELIAVHTPIVDVRYSPTSRRYEWSQEALQKQLHEQYQWIQALGNENYLDALTGKFTEPSIKLHDIDKGLASLQDILNGNGRAAIFCACASKTSCHRINVATLAKERLGVQVVHL